MFEYLKKRFFSFFLFFLLFFLFFFPIAKAFSFQESEEPKKIKVIILADTYFASQSGWQEKANNLFLAGASIFEKETGISFEIERFEIWAKEKEPVTLEEIAESIEKSFLRDERTIIIALIGSPYLQSFLFGFCLFQEGIVTVRVQGKDESIIKALLHELAHLFGAVHLDDPTSVMDLWNRGTNLDTLNLQIINLFRERKFNTWRYPLNREKRKQALSLYYQIAESLQDWVRRRQTETERSRRKIPNSLEDVFLSIAQIELEERNYKSAIKVCEEALKINPDCLEALNLMAIAQRRQGAVDEAISLYQKILQQKPGEARVLYNLGIALSKKGDFQAALEAYDKALALRPRMVEAMGNKAEILIRLGRETEAEEILERSLLVRKDFALALANLAEIYFRRKDYSKALEMVKMALIHDPELPEGHNMMGKMLHWQGKIEEAIKEFALALELDPGHAKAAHNLGNCFLELRRFTEALNYFQKALNLSPQFAEAYEGLGTCLLLLKDIDGAIDNFLRAKERGHNSLVLNLNLSTALIQKRKWLEAREAAEAALALEAKSAMAWNNLGICALELRDYPQAEKCFRQAVFLEPENSQFMANLASLLIVLRRWLEAAEIYVKLLKIVPNDGVSHNNLAYVYYQLKEYKLAWQHIEKALSLGLAVNPDFIEEVRKKNKGKISDEKN